MKYAIEGEFALLYSRKKWDPDLLRNPDTMSSDDLREILQMIYGFVKPDMPDSQDDMAQYNRVNAIVATLLWPDAKNRLKQRGLNDDEIAQLSVYQVVVPYIMESIQKEYDAIRCYDHVNRLTATEPEQAMRVKTSFPNEYHDRKTHESFQVMDVIMAMTHIGIEMAENMENRFAAMDDSLVIIEALRWYAAEHNGKLPEKLDEIQMAIIPNICRTTGEPFQYRLDGDVAELYVEDMYGNTFVWRISLRK